MSQHNLSNEDANSKAFSEQVSSSLSFLDNEEGALKNVPSDNQSKKPSQTYQHISKQKAIKKSKQPKRKIPKLDEIRHLVPQHNVTKQFYLYKPSVQLPDLYNWIFQSIEIRIACEYINKHNKEVLNRNLWGNESYTSNSDAVAIMLHHGLISLQEDSEKLQKYEGVALICKVFKNRKLYTSIYKNGILSKKIKGYMGQTLKPDHIQWLPSLGKIEDLTKVAKLMAINNNKSKRVKLQQFQKCNFNFYIPELSIVFNLCNEPAYRYSIMNICDKGLDQTSFTSYKLKDQVLFLENNQERYQIWKVQNPMNQEYIYDIFRIGKLKNPFQCDNLFMASAEAIPLEEEHVDYLFQEELEWSDFLWSSKSLIIKNLKIDDLHNYKFYPIKTKIN